MSRSRVLIVEDVRVIAHFMTRTLERAGYETAAVHHGDEALDAVRNFQPQAVVLDIVLPGLSGPEISRALRADPELKDLVIIFATGHAFDDEGAAELRAAGADWHFSKPVRPSALIAKLTALGLPPEQAEDADLLEEDPVLKAHAELVRELFAEARGIAVALETPAGPRWVHGEPVEGAFEEVITNEDDGPTLRIQAPADKPELLGPARALAAAVESVASLTQERDGLSGELGVAYESLTTIYEIGADPALLADRDLALARVVERATAFEPGLAAALWLLESEELRAVHWQGIDPPAARGVTGIVATVLEERRGRIWNDCQQLLLEEPELADARRIAAAPLLRGEDAVGALVLWSREDGLFDSSVMGLMTSLLSHAGMILEQDRLREEILAGERLKQEIHVGGEIQKTLLFGRVPKRLQGMDVGVVADASRHIGGDFFEIYDQGGGVVDVLVGDVMGKGLPAALVGAAVKSSFDRHANAAFLEPAAIVQAVHADVSERLIHLKRFVTLNYMRVDPEAGTLTFVDCGHPAVVHVQGDRTEGRSAEYPGQVNLPLGFLAETRYEQIAIPIRRGDQFLLYSDGFTEAADETGAMYGEERLAETLAALAVRPAQEAVDALRTDVQQFAEAEGLADDLTCVLVQVAPGPAWDSRKPRSLELPAVRGHLHAIRDLVERVCEDLPAPGLPEHEIGLLQVALTEAATNVVRHAYGEEEPRSLRIEAAYSAEALTFRVYDRGRPFRPDTIPAPLQDEPRCGGFGLLLMHGILDDVEYSREDDGRNCLLLTKWLPRQGCVA